MYFCHQAVYNIGTSNKAAMLCYREGNRRSGITLVIHYRLHVRAEVSTPPSCTLFIGLATFTPVPWCLNVCMMTNHGLGLWIVGRLGLGMYVWLSVYQCLMCFLCLFISVCLSVCLSVAAIPVSSVQDVFAVARRVAVPLQSAAQH